MAGNHIEGIAAKQGVYTFLQQNRNKKTAWENKTGS